MEQGTEEEWVVEWSGVEGAWGSSLGSDNHQFCDLRQFILPLFTFYGSRDRAYFMG